MDLVSRTEFEQPPDLRFRELAGTIALQSQARKGRPRDAGSSGLKMASDILRQVERDLHGWRLDAITLYQPATPPDSDWGLPAAEPQWQDEADFVGEKPVRGDPRGAGIPPHDFGQTCIVGSALWMVISTLSSTRSIRVLGFFMPHFT